jgi:hypothetical protein
VKVHKIQEGGPVQVALSMPLLPPDRALHPMPLVELEFAMVILK